MPEAVRHRLRQSLLARYAQLRHRLERALGSADDAADALQETWIKLGSVGKGTAVHNEEAYLLRMATNIAIDTYNKRSAVLSLDDIQELEHLADDKHDTLRQVSARLEMQELIQILQAMPERQRTVLIAARIDGLSYADIAREHGMSVALVNKEMCRALDFLRRQLAARAAAETACAARRQG